LGSNYLQGTIPPGIYDLVDLTTLKMEYNRLVGFLNVKINQLSKLLFLYLDHNQLSGSFVALPLNLRNLSLAESGLSGTLPQSFSMMQRLLTFSASNITGCWPGNFTAINCSYYDSLLYCSCNPILCSNKRGPDCVTDPNPPYYLCMTPRPDPIFNCINGSWVSNSSILIYSEITFDGSIIVEGNITISKTGTLVITENSEVQAENLNIQGGQLEITPIGDTSSIKLSGCANIEEGSLFLTFIPAPNKTLISASCILGPGFSNVNITNPYYDPNDPQCPVVMASSFQIFVISNPCTAIELVDGRPQFNWYLVIIVVSVLVLCIVLVVIVMKVQKCRNIVFPYQKRWMEEEEMKSTRRF